MYCSWRDGCAVPNYLKIFGFPYPLFRKNNEWANTRLPNCHITILLLINILLMTCWFKYPFYYLVLPNQLIKLIFLPLNSTSKAFTRLYSLAYAERLSLNTFGRSSILLRSSLPHRLCRCKEKLRAVSWGRLYSVFIKICYDPEIK